MGVETLDGKSGKELEDAKNFKMLETKEMNEAEVTKEIPNPFEKIKGFEDEYIKLIREKGGDWEKKYKADVGEHLKGEVKKRHEEFMNKHWNDKEMRYAFGDADGKNFYRVDIFDGATISPRSSFKKDTHEIKIRISDNSDPTGKRTGNRENSFIEVSRGYFDDPDENIGAPIHIQTREGVVSVAQSKNEPGYIVGRDKSVYDKFSVLIEGYLREIKKL